MKHAPRTRWLVLTAVVLLAAAVVPVWKGRDSVSPEAGVVNGPGAPAEAGLAKRCFPGVGAVLPPQVAVAPRTLERSGRLARRHHLDGRLVSPEGGSCWRAPPAASSSL